MDEFRGNHFFLTGFGYQHQISQLPALLGGKIFLIAWYDFGSAFDDPDSIDVNHEGSAGLIMDTKLGPFSIIGSYGEQGKGNVYFAFGKFL